MQSNMKKNSRSPKKSAGQRNDRMTSQRVGNVSVDSPGKYRGLCQVFPPRMRMKLKFWTEQTLSLAAALAANYRWRPSSAFDVDPALGGTAMPGFAEMAAIYATYRVYGSRIKATVPNPSASLPVTVFVVPLNADPTNAMSVANVIACSGQPYARQKTTGLLGSPPVCVENRMTAQLIWGDPATLYDHNFSSLVSASPTNNWFWNVALYAPAVIATSIVVSVEIEIDCEFFDRYFLPS